MVDIAISLLKSRFEELQSFKDIFGFLMSAANFKSLDSTELKYCSCLRAHSVINKKTWSTPAAVVGLDSCFYDTAHLGLL
jgi:hypothetical protein